MGENGPIIPSNRGLDISSVTRDPSSVMRDISTLFVAYVQIFAPTLGQNRMRPIDLYQLLSR